MSKARKERTRQGPAIEKLVKLERNARSRYTYFICGDADDGYIWHLLGPDDDTVCLSQTYANKRDCLASLRIARRHASTTALRDDAR